MCINHIPSEHWYTVMLEAPVCLYTLQRCECECEKALSCILRIADECHQRTLKRQSGVTTIYCCSGNTITLQAGF